MVPLAVAADERLSRADNGVRLDCLNGLAVADERIPRADNASVPTTPATGKRCGPVVLPPTPADSSFGTSKVLVAEIRRLKDSH